MSNLKKQALSDRPKGNQKNANEQDEATVKERVSKSVDDFYRRHGKVMTKLAYE